MRLTGYDARTRRGLHRRGHTLVEVITVVLILSILACIAVPRLNLAASSGARADAVVQQITTALRRARAQAVLHAAENPVGYVLVMNGDAPYVGYQIVSLQDSTVIADSDIPNEVACSGGRRFAFGPLGNLVPGSDTELRLAAESRVYFIQVEPATGTVKWIRRND
ncbi:MAG: type II secretion system protein [Phycisphaerales bacterium]